MKKLFKKMLENQIENEKILMKKRMERLENERKNIKQVHERNEEV